MKFKRKTKKIIVIGYENIGKTSIAYRFMYDCFPMQNQDYFLEDAYSRIMLHKKEKIEVKTTDQHSLDSESFINVQLFQAHAYIFMYSITDRESFQQIQMIRKNIIKSTGQTIPSILIGNKLDLKEQRQVLKREGKIIAQLWNVKFHEISVKDCEIEDIQNIYEELLTTIDDSQKTQNFQKIIKVLMKIKGNQIIYNQQWQQNSKSLYGFKYFKHNNWTIFLIFRNHIYIAKIYIIL